MDGQTYPADRALIRNINQSSLLNLIRAKAPVSRPQLVVLSGLSSATVLSITNGFIEKNLVVERGVTESTGGRKAGLLEIRPDGGFAVGLKPTEYGTAAVILDLNGNLVYSEQWDLLLKNRSQEAIALLAEGAHQFIERSGINKEHVIGIGCGLGGFIHAEEGRCIDSQILGWQDLEISGPLAALLDIPVFIDNDVNCLTIYEKLFGHGKSYSHFLVVTSGRGIGLGIVVNGGLYRGARGGAGELGHTTIISDGRQCECGKRGCLEAYASDPGIVRNYCELLHLTTYSLERMSQEMTILEVLERAQRGEKAAIAAFQRAGMLLGASMANLVNIFNPECIILSCPDAGIVAGELLIGPMQEMLKLQVFSQLGMHLPLITETPGYERWAQGAGSLVLHQLFSSPATVHTP